MNMQKQTVMLFALLCFVTQLFAQGPNNSGTYYQAADGKKGKREWKERKEEENGERSSESETASGA